MGKVTEAIKIRNFIQYNSKPFTLIDVANNTECNKNTILRELRQHELSGTIKSISKQSKSKTYRFGVSR